MKKLYLALLAVLIAVVGGSAWAAFSRTQTAPTGERTLYYFNNGGANSVTAWCAGANENVNLVHLEGSDIWVLNAPEGTTGMYLKPNGEEGKQVQIGTDGYKKLYYYKDDKAAWLADTYSDVTIYVDVTGTNVTTPYVHYWNGGVKNNLSQMVKVKDNIYKFIIPTYFTNMEFTGQSSWGGAEYFKNNGNGTSITDGTLYKLSDGTTQANYDPNASSGNSNNKMYLITKGSNWDLSSGEAMTKTDDGFTLTNVSFVENDYLIFTTELRSNAGDWDGMQTTGYGASDDNQTIGVNDPKSIQDKSKHAYKVSVTGTGYTVTVDLKKNTVTITGGNSSNDDAEYYLVVNGDNDNKMPFTKSGDTYTLTPAADFVLKTSDYVNVLRASDNKLFGHSDKISENKERDVYDNNNGEKIYPDKNVKNITSITFKLDGGGSGYNKGILKINGTWYEASNPGSISWPELYFRGSFSSWGNGYKMTRGEQIYLGYNNAYKCVYSVTADDIKSLKDNGGLTGDFKIGTITNHEGLWDYAYGKDFNTNTDFRKPSDVVILNQVKANRQNTGYRSGLGSDGVDWNLTMNDQTAEVESITFTLYSDDNFAFGDLLISGKNGNDFDPYADNWFVVNEDANGVLGNRPSTNNQMTVVYDKDGKKVYKLDVENFKGSFNFMKGSTDHYSYGGTKMVCGKMYDAIDPANAKFMELYATSKSTEPVKGDLLGDVRFYVIEQGDHVTLLVMKNYIALAGLANDGYTKIDPTLKLNRFVPQFDGTYSLTIPKVNAGYVYVSNTSGNPIYYGYNAASKDDRKLGMNRFVPATSYSTGIDYTIDTFEPVTFIWDESQPALMVANGEFEKHDVQLYGDFNSSAWWEYDKINDPANKINLKLKEGTTDVYYCGVNISTANKEFDVYIDKQVYGPKNETTINLNSTTYGVAKDYAKGDYQYKCGNDKKWVFKETGMYYVEVNVSDETVTVYKGSFSDLALSGMFKNNGVVHNDWEAAPANGHFTMCGPKEYELNVVFEENSVNEGNRFLVMLNNNKDSRFMHPTYGNFPLHPGEKENLTLGDKNCFFMAEGSYRLIVTEENSAPKNIRVEGRIYYPEVWYIFGDLVKEDGTCTKGCPKEENSLVMMDTKFDAGFTGEVPEEASGYYIIRRVKFHNHEKWHDGDNHSTEFGVFGITSKPLPNNHSYSNSDRYKYLGTRLGSRPTTGNGTLTYCDGSVNHTTETAEITVMANVSWGYNENIDAYDFVGVNWINTRLMGVNACCFHAPGKASAQTTQRFASDKYASDEFDVVFDLNRNRVALANEAIETSVEGIESMWGENKVNVYTIQGTLVRSNVMEKDAVTDLPAGIYIVGKKKVYVTK